jgi:hypothetical protein
VKKRLLRLYWRCETVLALWLAWLLVFVVPFRHTAKLIGGTRQSDQAAPPNAPAEGLARPMGPALATLKRATAVTRRILWLAPRLPFATTCLVRAIAGWLLLRRRHIPATIRFGVAMEDGKLAAHAWLIVGGQTLLGGAEAEGYQPLADLGGIDGHVQNKIGQTGSRAR